MCSLLTNKTADDGLKNIPKDHSKAIEKKFSKFAADSTKDKPGILDAPQNHLHVLPASLKAIRRRKHGRHRVFYIGQHSHCSFTLIYIKEFKKKGEKEEADSGFHGVLKRALDDTGLGRTLRDETAKTTDKKLLIK